MRDELPVQPDPEEYPPRSMDSERALLGCIFILNDLMDLVDAEMQDEYFYHDAHRRIYKAMRRVRARHSENAYDASLIATELETTNELREVGGIDYLRELVECVGYTEHWTHYAKEIRRTAALRMIDLATSNAKGCIRKRADPAEIIQETDSALMGILSQMSNAELKTCVDDAAEFYAELNSTDPIGIPTGFRDLDDLTHGWQPTDLALLGARTSVGKTSLAVAFSVFAARMGHPNLFISIEMNRKSLFRRFVSFVSKVPLMDIRKRALTNEQHQMVSDSLTELNTIPALIDDRANTLAKIAASCRIHKRRSKIKLVIVDYLGFIQPEKGDRDSRERQVAKTTYGLKQIAKDLDIAILCLVQLNREVERRGDKDKKPKLSDLRESGAIEQDGDLIMLLDQPWRTDQSAAENVGRLQVAKQRNGMLGEVSLLWTPETSSYSPKEWESPFMPLEGMGNLERFL